MEVVVLPSSNATWVLTNRRRVWHKGRRAEAYVRGGGAHLPRIHKDDHNVFVKMAN
jgi:hypothetical protein